MQVNGIVEQTGNRATRTGTVHSLKVNGQWYGGIWEDPGINQGATVSFNAEQSGNFWNVKGAIEQSAAAAAPASGGAPAVSTRDISIQYQSSRKDAIQLLPFMFEQGAVKFDAKTKQADKYDAICAMVDELTVRNYLVLQEVIDAGGVNPAEMLGG